MRLVRHFITNPHTSYAALVFFALDVAAVWFPEEKEKLEHIKTLALFYGLYRAEDGGNPDKKTSIPCKCMNHKKTDRVILGLAILTTAILCACSSFRSVQVQTKADGTKTESRQSVFTFWDAQSQVAKLRASTTDKTQGLTVGGLVESSEATNAVNLIETVTRAAVAGAIGAAK